MITAAAEPLPIKTENDFREWLRRPQVETLRKVIRAKQQEEACLSLNDAKQANTGNWKLEAANVHLLKAQRYQAFLDVLQEVTDQLPNVPFNSVKLT